MHALQQMAAKKPAFHALPNSYPGLVIDEIRNLPTDANELVYEVFVKTYASQEIGATHPTST
ncbi:hypothetical protein PM082_000279 [Marasmius tenuissimus]|nr:hypothetical protein PM082_000279 [Marasmius tenuissimus]